VKRVTTSIRILRQFHGTRCNASSSHHPYLSQKKAEDGSTISAAPSYALEKEEEPTNPKGGVLHGIPIRVGG
jgi:hypothetical protein